MKRRWALLLVVLSVSGMLFASDWHFAFGDVAGHSRIFGGALPTYVKAGADYDGLALIDGRRTELEMMLGAGYGRRKVWDDPKSSSLPLLYDLFETDWSVRFSQGFLASSEKDRDLLTAYAGYDGTFEIAFDPLTSGWPYGDGTSDSGYATVTAGTKTLGTALLAGLRLDLMDGGAINRNGLSCDIRARFGPSFLNDVLDGNASYYVLSGTAIAEKTLYAITEKERNLFSVVLADRALVSWTGGTSVPDRVLQSVALGGNVRGFSPISYNAAFSAVNNFEIRFNGPEPLFRGLFPRVTLFFDSGYGGATYLGSGAAADAFLSSVGVLMAVSVFDTVDLGYQMAYLFSGENYDTGAVITGTVSLRVRF